MYFVFFFFLRAVGWAFNAFSKFKIGVTSSITGACAGVDFQEFSRLARSTVIGCSLACSAVSMTWSTSIREKDMSRGTGLAGGKCGTSFAFGVAFGAGSRVSKRAFRACCKAFSSKQEISCCARRALLFGAVLTFGTSRVAGRAGLGSKVGKLAIRTRGCTFSRN